MTSTSTSKQIGKVALTPAGNWDNTNEYEKLDVVYYQGGSYVAKKAVPVATNITNEEYWQTLAEKASNLTIGTVTTVSADTGASASIGGTANTPTLNLSIPRGIPGNESIDDTKGIGDTDYVWSADKTAKVKNNIAPDFDTSIDWKEGDFVLYQDQLYQYCMDHDAGAWLVYDPVPITVGEAINNAKNYTDKICNISLKENPVSLVRYTGNFSSAEVGTVPTYGTGEHNSHTFIDLDETTKYIDVSFWYVSSVHLYGVFLDADGKVMAGRFWINDGIYTSSQVLTIRLSVPDGAAQFVLVSATNATNFAARTRCVKLTYIPLQDQITNNQDTILDNVRQIGTVEVSGEQKALTRENGNFSVSNVGYVVAFNTSTDNSHCQVAIPSNAKYVMCNFWYKTTIANYAVFTDENDIIIYRFRIDEGIYTTAQQLTDIRLEVPEGAKKLYLVSATNATNFAARTAITVYSYEDLQSQIIAIKEEYPIPQTTGYIYSGDRPLLKKHYAQVESHQLTIDYTGFSSATSQGMESYGDYIFIAQKSIKSDDNPQYPYLHILDASDLTHIRSIPLPTADISMSATSIHSNSLSFGEKQNGYTYPLLYLTAMWNHETYGYNECLVFQLADDLESATFVQKIYYLNGNNSINSYSSNFIIDAERGYLYMFGNTNQATSSGSTGKYLKQFLIPDPTTSEVILTENDIIKEFMLNDKLFANIGLSTYQGAEIFNGQLFAPFSGNGKAIVVLDVNNGNVINYLEQTWSNKETEDCCIINGKLYVNTADNYMYTISY